MSRLGSVLTVLMDDHGYTGITLSKKTKLLPSFISRIKTGQQAFIAKEDLAKISACFMRNQRTGKSTPHDAAELIRAHLEDERVGPGSHLVDVVLRSHEGDVEPKGELPPEAQRALDFLRDKAIANKAAESFIIEAAKVLGMQPKTKKE